MKKTTVVLAGIGGYGGVYLSELLHKPRGEEYTLVGAVDPFPDGSAYKAELLNRNIPLYETLEAFYAHHTAALAILATPIHLHAAQSILCMEHGSDVMCEKPLCAAPEDGQRMIETRNRLGRRLAVGFQWCYQDPILQLKQDLLSGIYGNIRRIRTRVLFPRNRRYYARPWAAKRFLATGEAVFDCVASNATAHYLQNMLFLTGKALDCSAGLKSVTAEVYRANEIEMYDTCAFRIMTEEDAELIFLATHAVPMAQERTPEFILEGDKGTVCLENNKITGTVNGQTRTYGAPCPDNFRSLDYMTKEALLPCRAEAAMAHLSCVYHVAQSFPTIPEFGKPFTEYSESDDQFTCRGLTDVLEQCYQNGTLPSEERAPWAILPHTVSF